MESLNVSKSVIYILLLEGGRYYIGMTNNFTRRFKEHSEGKGSEWTRKYPPLSIVKTISSSNPFDEDKYVKEYMYRYGIHNVRGGSYVTEKLDNSQMKTLKTEIWQAKKCCTRCGRNNHFIKECYAMTDVYGYLIDEKEYVFQCSKCKKEFFNESDCTLHLQSCKRYNRRFQLICFKCGRSGHDIESCYDHIEYNYSKTNNKSVKILITYDSD